MKLNTTDFVRKMQCPMLMALTCFPLVMLVVQTAAPEAVGRMWLFPVLFTGLGWGCILLPGKLRIPGGLAGIVLMWVMAAVCFPLGAHPVLALPTAVYSGMLFFVLPVGGWERGRELALAWPMVGVLTHVIMQLLTNGSRNLGEDIYGAGERTLLISFLALLVLTALSLNRSSLKDASQSRRSIPLLMRRQNRVLTLALVIIGVLVAAIPAIGDALAWVGDMFMRLMAYVGALLAMLMPQKGAGVGGAAPGEGGAGLGEANEPSQFALIMEKIIGVLALVVLVIGLFFFLRMLWKKLRKLLRYLWERLGKYGSAASEDYEDEVTSTREEEEIERMGLLKRLRRLAPEDEAGLDPTQRVRSRYRRMMRRGNWARSSTAREQLPPEAAGLYERARYSGQTLTEEEAERFRERTRRVK